MKKFIIEVNSELDSEYIQKLALNVGYKCCKGVDIFMGERIKYLFFHATKEITWADSTYDNQGRIDLYKFPEQINDIIILFLKQKEVEFKIGDWVKVINDSDDLGGHYGNNGGHKVGYIFKIHQMEGSVNHLGQKWIIPENEGAILGKQCAMATHEEIEKHLIKEAEKRGLVIGAKVSYGLSCNKIKSFALVVEINKSNNSGVVIDKFNKEGIHLACNMTLGGCIPVDNLCLVPLFPQIKINGYTAEFFDWGISFNNCAKIHKQVFIELQKAIRVTNSINSNKSYTGEHVNNNRTIESVKIGKGEFTATQINEIADYYTKKKA